MIRVIMGKKGSGKTKQMIDMIDNAVQTEHGNVVCIERGSKLTYDIHYQIRLVEASSYDIDSYATLKGFVSGLYAGNYDITHIFIDSLCKIVPGPCDNETEKFLDWLNAFGEKHGIKFTITISDDASLLNEIKRSPGTPVLDVPGLFAPAERRERPPSAGAVPYFGTREKIPTGRDVQQG